MATMSTSSRFDDQDYKNWLKCSVALIQFKESLHDYINKEVNNLHVNICNTISAIPVGTSVQNLCYTCTWQDIKWNKGTWTINCPSQICDKWLSEILANHTNPQNRNINWKNADITMWPTDPYEVAKVYMPKGQNQTKNLPQDFDAPAILSLLKYCAWFNQMIPNSNIVTDLIDIRNELMHSGDLRFTDFKKDNCIDRMVQLLSDLNIHGDVLIELQKIKREDIDINFRETEVRALYGLLHQLTDDLDTIQTTLSSVQNDQVQERQDIKELIEIYQKIKSFLANNPDIDDKNISENIHAIEKTVIDLESKFEKKHQELETKITSIERGMERKFAEIEEKIETKQSTFLEDMNSLRSELLHRYKSFGNLPFSIDDKDEEVPLEILYTEVVIKSEDKQSAYDNRSSNKERSIGNEKEQGTRLTSYKHIFNGGKRTILTGLSGSGKSTICRNMVNAWCKLQENKKFGTSTCVEASLTHESSNLEGHSPHHSSNVIVASTLVPSEVVGSSPHDSSDVIKDENFLLEFDLLFYISSPAISNETKLTNVLCNQCIKREQKWERDKIQKKLSKLLHDQPEKILIIFDDLDEMGHNPKFLVDIFRRDLYPGISVLMAMRPSEISKLDLKPLSHYDLLIDIKGFSADNALKFVQKVIDINSSIKGEKKKIFLTKTDREILTSFKHIPLLLLFLAQSWYREQSLLRKYKELMSQIIAFLIKRWVKKAGNKCTVNRSDEESMNLHLKHFRETYFSSACKVAYLFLLEVENSQSNVIPQKELVRELGENSEGKLNTLLDCGIISKVDVSQPEKNVSVTFLHMSIQEYLASIYLVRDEEAFHKFLRSIQAINDIFRYENLFRFISGLNARKCHNAFTRICEVCDEDIQVIQYRQHGDNCEVIQNLNVVYKKCLNEMKNQQFIEMPDIFITGDTDYKLLMSKLKPNFARSLYLGRISCDELDLNTLTNLTSLRLEHVIKPEECSITLCSSIKNFINLEVLYLDHITLDDGVLDLKYLTNLTDLKLFDVTMSEECSISLCKSICICTCLEMLFLEFINLHDGVLYLRSLTSLISLTMKNVTMSMKCNKYLCISISSCSRLKKLHLCHFMLLDNVLDLGSFPNLITLTLEDIIMPDEYSRSLSSSISRSAHLKNLHLENIKLHDCVLSLQNLTNLTTLRLHKITISNESCRTWYGSINMLTHLQILNLSDLTLQDGVIDLRSLTNLLNLTLKNITMSEACSKSQCSIINSCTFLKILLIDSITLHHGVLDLRFMTSLARLTLLNVTMSVECAASLCSSISHYTSLEDLNMKNITLHDGVLDSTYRMNLNNLTLFSVTMSDECSRSLCSSISGYTRLQNLNLKNIKLHDGILVLRSLTKMNTLRLDDVTMSEECSRSFCSSLSRCTDLITMNLKNISLHNGVLDLSSLTSLTDLTLKNVTMLDTCIMSLCSSIRGCFCLENLYLDNIKLHNGVLDLGSLTKMNSLKLNNVTMCEECSISLCSSISGYSHLKKLHLTSIKLHDGVLDLRPLASMNSLRIDNVTMSEECCRSVSSSISSLIHLQKMYLKDINLHYGVLDLRSLTKLDELTLLHVTMSKEGSRSLCCSLCGYARLENLNLTNINLHDGVLDLSSLTNMTEIALDDVIMSEKCYKYLCSSISRCTNLTKLKFISLHTCALDLSSLGNLTDLTLDNVTVLEEYGMQSGINTCTFLVKLCLENIELHDSSLDLSFISNLTNLTLNNVDMLEEVSVSLCNYISGCTSLEKLYLSNIIIHGILDLGSLTNLTDFTLDSLRMHEECTIILCSSISGCTCLKNIRLYNIKLNDGVLDMRFLKHIHSLRLCQVTISDECSKSLCSSISIFTQLKTMELKYISLHDSALDLSSLTNMTDLILDNVIMSEECSRSFCSSLSRCTDLNKMKLKNISIDDGVLDFISLTKLTNLTLENVKMLDACSMSVCRSISDCTCLKNLYLDNIKLHDGVLVLGSLTKMNSLRLHNVTMCGVCSISLCSGISVFVQLEKLLLKSVKLHDGVLDLRSLTNIKSLRIDNVAMSDTCSKSLCSSISAFSHLEELYLDNITLPYGVSDLRSLTKLKDITLLHVTMSEECSRSLCSSINSYAHLEKLHLKHVKLHDGVLDLRSLTNMTFLRIDNVAMSEECSRSLCSSINGYANLEKLHLKHIELHDGELDLRFLTKLKDLTLLCVTMSEECSRSLCSCISSFTHLEELYLEDIKLHFGRPDLRSLTKLSNLTMLNVTMSEDGSRSLCYSISGYARLENLNLKNINLHDGVLDLRSVSNMTDLTLDSITMLEECIISLCDSISGCASLEKLYLHNIILDGKLDLSSLTNLTDLKLNNVIMYEDHTMSLYNIISGCTCLKHLCLYNIKLNDAVLDVRFLTTINSLRLCNVTMSKECSRSLCRSINIFTHLKSMELKYISLYDGVLYLNSLTNMSHLTLDDVIMSEVCSRSLCSSLSTCTDLITMKLKNISLHNGVLDLSSLTGLTDLTLENVAMLDTCIMSLCSSIRGCFCLENLYLDNIKLHNGVLDLGSLTKMNSLKLNNVTMCEECSISLCSSISGFARLEKLHLKNIKLHDGVLDLKFLTKMNSFRLDGVTMSKECSRSLCCSISSFTHLQKLYLEDITLHYDVPDLRSLKNLKDFTLLSVIMSVECCRSLCSIINSYAHLENLHLKNIKLHDGVLDLRSLTNMNSLRLDCVTMSEECCRSLCCRISTFTHLEELYLDNITLPYGVPDLRSLTKLKDITLLHVTMSEEYSRSLCNSINGYAHLEKLHLKHVKLHDGVLDLRSLTNMTFLRIDNVAMSEECCRSLCSSISNLTHLEELYLDNITLHYDVPDLRSLTKLKDITLLHVTMSEECSRSLCSSINGYAHLEKLHLKHVRLHDGVLDLRSLTNMTFLRLVTVTMSEECSRSMCSSISSFTHLEELYLEDIKLHYGRPDLRFLTNLTGIALLRVTMSQECSRSLCRGICGCARLENLYLKDIKLHDSVLDLSSLTNLTEVTLDEVIMSEKCCRSLCSSIGRCTNLTKMKLKFISLNKCVLDLSSLTKLTDLILDNVTVSRMILSMCSSINNCTFLVKLYLHHIELHDSILDLSDIGNLTDLALDNVDMLKECNSSLCNSISRCAYLEKLFLHNIILHGILNLSSLFNLTDLSMNNVTMSEECTMTLCSSIRGCTCLKSLYMYNIKLNVGVLDLEYLTNMNSLRLCEVTISDKSSISLCSSISIFTHLKTMELKNISLHDGGLDLTSLTNLTDLILVDVIMSEESIRSLCNTISRCTGLKVIKLKKISLQNRVLDISSITGLTLVDVIMSEECSRSFCSSLSRCTNLNKMKLKNIALDDGVLDLSSLTSMTDLALENVTMSVECRTSLYSSLRRCTDLKEMKLKNISLHYDLLDLTSLTDLTLDDVIMSEECSRSVCSSINGHSRLENLHLKNIKLHDGILVLRSLTNMISLTLDDVIMSEECSRSLCSSLSRCSDLIKMKLKNISLHDGVLDLSSLTNLIDLILENVTMMEECSNTLCSSICFCTCLENLYLYNIQLHQSIIDLTSLTNLIVITVEKVSMSNECKISLKNSSSSCKNLLELNLKKLEVDDAKRSNRCVIS